MKKIDLKGFYVSVFLVMVFCFTGFIVSQIIVEKTIPEKVEVGEIQDFVIKVENRTIEVYLTNGLSGRLTKSQFLNFWNNDMTASQKAVVKGFVKQLSTLAMNVNSDKVTGELMD